MSVSSSVAMTGTVSAAIPVLRHDREWWRAEALRTRADWSRLLRQRVRVLAWVHAGRPPLAQWIKTTGPQ
jgi:hypothetical protein